jgi:hypothetical protein
MTWRLHEVKQGDNFIFTLYIEDGFHLGVRNLAVQRPNILKE